MPGPSVTITLFEKVTYLRGQSASENDRHGRHRRNVLDQEESQPSQLRGLVTVHLPKPTRIKSVELTLSGQGRTDWPEGIGNNRVELAETTQFFKEQVTLFDARAEAAPAPPLRRSHSVGPGIGLTDDVDWNLIGQETDDRASKALAKAFSSSNAKANSGKSDKEKFARSAGKLAVKAGGVILPPTLLRELAGTSRDGPSGTSGKKSKSQQQQQSPQNQPSSSRPTSPTQARFPPLIQHHRQRQHQLPPPVYAAVEPPPPPPSVPNGDVYFASQLRSSSASSSLPSTPSGSSPRPSASGRRSPLPSPQLGPPPQVPNLPPQSVTAGGPHSRSILQAPRRKEGNQESSPQSHQTVSSSSASSHQPDQTAVETIDQNTPSTRAQTAGRPTLTSAGLSMVRFNSKDLPGKSQPTEVSRSSSTGDPTVAVSSHSRRRGSSASNIEVPSEWSAMPSRQSPPRTVGFATHSSAHPTAASAPTSRRPSVDFSTMDSSGRVKSKGKGKATGDGKGTQPHKLPGLKDILGGLRREDNPAKQTKDGQGSSNNSSNNNSNGSSPGSSRGIGAKLSSKPTSPRNSRRSTETSRPGSLFSSGMAAPSQTQAGGGQAPNSGHAPHSAPQFNAPQSDWREFQKGTYTYSISLPLPANLPPTLHADFGHNRYNLKATVRRSGPLTPNLTAEREVVLVHAPDEDGTEETEAIVVERTWEDALTYRVFVSGRSFACGSTIPLWVKLIPLGEKVKVWRLTATLEEKTHYYAKQRKVARHETPRRTVLLKVIDPDVKPLLPIISNSADALASSQLGRFAIAAAGLNVPPEMRRQASESPALRQQSGPSSSSYLRDILDEQDDEEQGEEVNEAALASLLDPAGPWELSMNLELPGKSSRVNISSDHAKSCIAVSHALKLSFRVERMVEGKAKLFDIVIEAPIRINHSHTAEAWLSLPEYWSVASGSSPLTAAPEQEAYDGDYFSRQHHPASCNSREPSSSSMPATPNGLAPSSSSGGQATPVNIGNSSQPRSRDPATLSPTPGPSSSVLPASWSGTAGTRGPVSAAAATTTSGSSPPPPPRGRTTSPRVLHQSNVMSGSSSGADADPSMQTNATQWLALSIARDEAAGRSERMVAFAADGNAGNGATGASEAPSSSSLAQRTAEDELPPPYSVDDARAAGADLGSASSSSSATAGPIGTAITRLA